MAPLPQQLPMVQNQQSLLASHGTALAYLQEQDSVPIDAREMLSHQPMSSMNFQHSN
jgi:hypothetical protein